MNVLGTLFVIIVYGMMYNLKYGAAIDETGYFFTLCNRKDEVPTSSICKPFPDDRCNIETSTPKLISVTTL